MDQFTELVGMLFCIPAVAAVLAAPISFALIWLYRRAVIRLMSKPAGPNLIDSTKQDKVPLPSPTSSIKAKLDFLDYGSATEDSAGSTLHDHLRLRRWQAAGIYVIGGLGFAGLTTQAMIRSNDFIPSAMMIIVFTWIFLWPSIFAINLVASPAGRSARIAVQVYCIVGVLITALGVGLHPEFDWISAIVMWASMNAIPTLLVWAFLYRRIRAIGQMVFVFVTLSIVGPLLPIYGEYELYKQAINHPGLARNIMYPVLDVLPNDGPLAWALLILLLFFGFLLMVCTAWLTLQFLKWLYLHKRQSGHSLILDPIWFMFGFFYSLLMASYTNDPWWFLFGPAVFAAYKIITWIGFAWLNRNQMKTPGPKLLLLRVFSLAQRSEQLYSAISKAWCYVGNIRFITGPDLVAATVEPHNFLDYISRKLHLRFIDNSETLEQRLAQADNLPDLDGRYRVLDFFCHDNTWKMVLSRLAKDSDVVLMDLRQFSRTNAGCVFEIEELMNYVPLNRVIFVTDKTTDEGFLRESIEKAWEHMHHESPNLKEKLAVRLFSYSDSKPGEYNRLLHALSVAAMPG